MAGKGFSSPWYYRRSACDTYLSFQQVKMRREERINCRFYLSNQIAKMFTVDFVEPGKPLYGENAGVLTHSSNSRLFNIYRNI